MTIFFKIGSIEVTGISRLSGEEIINASGINVGDNLFLMSKAKAQARIVNAFSYAENVKISRKLPDTLIIDVREATPVAEILSEKGYWLVSRDGKLLECCSAADENLISVVGFTLLRPQPGQIMESQGGEYSGATALINLFAALNGEDALAKTSEIDLAKSYAVTIRYDNRFNVSLGKLENLDYKIQYLLQIVQNLGPDAKGTVNLTRGSKAEFIPD